jgi:hypothetical protein
MSIMNRRNAMIGWAAVTIGKRLAKRKAKAAIPTIDAETKRPNRPAMMLGALAAAGGALLFWRRRGAGDGDNPIE